MNNAIHLKKILFHCIDELTLGHREFLMNPNTQFTRKRKLTFEETIKLILTMEAGSLKDELYKYFGLNLENPSSSAFVQQRQKISFHAFEWLFYRFNELASQNKKYKGYRLLAVDGSTIPIRFNKSDEETFLNRSGNQLGYNAYHLNAVYDLLENNYTDVVIQGEAHMNENGAFNQLVDQYDGDKAIFIADRGYESLNSFVHAYQANQCFLIRVKDVHSKTSVARSFHPPLEGEFDIEVKRTLTRKYTNEIKRHPEKYKYMPKHQRFDFFGKAEYYDFKCRVVRFKISKDNYEVIMTNLKKEDFSAEEIKSLYYMRWGIETSFRELKYAVGMNAFHAKNNNSIKQEIYAKLLFYNFSERIMRKVKPRQKKQRLHEYQINFTRAFHNIRVFLLYKKGGIKPPDIESIIAKEIEPIRPNRSDPRKVRPKSLVYFTYRFI